MNRQNAETQLQEIFKLPSFYDDQWEAIEKLLKGERVLLVEKTGFGKSLCYQFPATQLKGLTVIFSPLIALMRDQVNYLKSLGISAECINSEQSAEENEAIIEKAINNQIKILYIAPERQENTKWLEAVGKMNLAMVVVDEAHCISVWGHDFRPAFRRIVDLVKLLPTNFPVLATTATATEKTAQDIKAQLGAEKVSYIRGDLLRSNFKIRVVKMEREEDKLGGLFEFVRRVGGTGLVYTGTRVNTDVYANFLIVQGIDAIAYNAGLEAETRKEIEAKLKNNEVKCVVSTNALGMGIDKKDIRFIIHTQMPASPIHYYQEIGRAGRDGKETDIILFYNPQDRELPEYFINTARPSKEHYERVVEILQNSSEPLGAGEIIKRGNLRRGQTRTIKADLIEQGIIRENIYGGRKKYEYQHKPPKLDLTKFEELRKFRFEELEKMVEYIKGRTCRMRYLRNYLGDKTSATCGKCDSCSNKDILWRNPAETEKRMWNFYNNYFPKLEIANEKIRLTDGVAAAYYGHSNVGAVIHKCKYENGGEFPSPLMRLTIKAYRKHFKNTKFDLILFVPPTESGDLVRNFAEKISKILNVPISYNLYKVRKTKPQKVFQNYWNKKENVKDAFAHKNPRELYNKNVLLLDDIFDSGASIKEIAKALSQHRIKLLTPLVIAKTTGGVRV